MPFNLRPCLNMLEQYGLSVDKIKAIIACCAEDICGRCCTSKKQK